MFNFIIRFNISPNDSFHLLHSDPDVLNVSLSFFKGFGIVKCFRIVINTAEKGVKLIQAYNTTLTKEEERKEDILKVIAEY